MSNTVDNRVVEMKFDNQQFEAGVRQTIASLDSLKEALKFNTSATNISSLQNAINGFSLRNIENSLDSLTQRFSAMGIAGMTVISNLTNKAIGLAEKLGSISIGQIMTGGKARAQKVANARFQLEGLLDTAEEVESAFTSAQNAVDGTAYGLDAAVSTASQLAASNVQLGKDMDEALRGVAGLAAMTNTDFEYMGNIFATVAGNGRLMGMQLSQISAHGVNAAATLAKELNKTEEEVRSMVSKGEISFSMFAEAMNNAFGDQAQKANETLNGALSNVKSALSRIGEIFYSGIIENKDFINFVNDIRVAINKVKKQLEPLKKPFATLVSSASKLGHAMLNLFNVDGMTGLVDKVATGMNTISGWLFYAAGLLNNLKKIVDNTLGKTVEKVEKTNKVLKTLSDEQKAIVDNILWGNNDYGNGEARKNALGDQYQDIQDYINLLYECGFDYAQADEKFSESHVESAEKVKEANETTYSSLKPSLAAMVNIRTVLEGFGNIGNSVKKVLGAIGKAFKNVFSKKDLSKDVYRLVNVFKSLTEQFFVTDSRAEKLEQIFTGLFSVVDILRQVFVTLVEVLSGTAAPILSKLIDIFLWVAAGIANVVTKFNQFIKEHDTLRRAGNRIVTVFTKIANVVGEFFSKFNDLPAVNRLKKALGDFVSGIGSKLMEWFGLAGDKVDGFFEKINDGDTSAMDKVLGKINEALNKFLDLTEKAGDNLKDLKQWLTDKSTKVSDLSESFDKLKLSIKSVKKESTQTPSSKEDTALDGVSNGFTKIYDKFKEMAGNIGDYISKIDYARVALLGFATSIITLLGATSYFTFNAGKFMKAAITIPDTFKSIAGSFSRIVTSINSYMKNKSKADLIKAYAIAMVAFVASLIALTFVDQKKLNNASKQLSILMGVFGLVIAILSEIMVKSSAIEGFNDRLKSLALVVIAMGAAVLLLATAVKELTEIKWDKDAYISLGVLVGLMAALLIVSLLFAKGAMPETFRIGTISILLYSAAVYLLVKALKKLESIDVEKMEDRLKILLEVMVLVGIVALAASRMSVGSALGVLVLIGSIWLIEKALKYIMDEGISMDDIKKHLGQFIPVIVALGILAGATIAIGIVGKRAKGSIGLVLSIAASILVITYALRKLAVLAWVGMLDDAVKALIKIFAGIALLVFIISKGKASYKGIGWTILLIAGAIYILGTLLENIAQIPEDKAWRGVAIVGILAGMMAVLLIVSRFAGKVKATTVLSMVAVVAALALMVALLAEFPDFKKLFDVAILMGVLLIAFGTSMWLATQKINKSSGQALLTMVGMLVVIAGSLYLLTTISDGDYGKMITAAGAIGIVLLAVAVTLYSLHSFSAQMTAARLKALEHMVQMMIYLIAAIAVISISISAILYMSQNWQAIAAAGGALAGVFAALAIAINWLQDTRFGPGDGAGMLLASLSFVAIAGALALLLSGNYNWEQMRDAAIVLGAIFGIITIAMGALAKVSETGAGGLILIAVAAGFVIVSAAMIGMAFAANLMVDALKKLTTVNFKVLKDNFGTMVKMVLIFGTIAAVGMIAGVALILIGNGILLIGIALSAVILSLTVFVSALGNAAVQISVLVISITSLLSMITKMSKNSKQISKGVKELSNSVGEFLVTILTSLATGIVRFLSTLGANTAVIAESFGNIISAIVLSISKNLTKINAAIIDGIIIFLDMLIEKSPDFLERLDKLFIIFGNFLLSQVEQFAYYGAALVYGFLIGTMEALEDYLPELTDRTISLIDTYMASLADALIDNSGLMGNAARSLILSVVYTTLSVLDDVTHGFFSKFEGFREKMQGLKDEQEELSKERAELQAEKEIAQEAKSVEREKRYEQEYIDAGVECLNTYGQKKFQKAGKDIGEVTGNAQIEGLESTNSEFVKHVKDMPSQAVEEAKKSGKWTLANGGKELVYTGADAVDENSDVFVKSVKGMSSQAKEEMKKSLGSDWHFSDNGEYIIKSLSASVADAAENQNGSDSVVGTLLNHLGLDDQINVDTLQEKWGGFIGSDQMKDLTGELGLEFGDDYLSGFNESFVNTENANLTYGYVQDYMKENVLGATKSALDENSPSKEAEEIGMFFIFGLRNGLTKYSSTLSNASENAVNPMMTSMAKATQNLYNAFNSDLNSITPKIKPVVDTGNLDQTTGYLGSLLSSASSINTNSSFTFRDNVITRQLAELNDKFTQLTNKDYSEVFKGVNINVNSNTNVDGTPLKKTSSEYTIQQIDEQKRAYLMSVGARY